MIQSVKLGVPNGVIFLGDPRGTTTPEWTGPLIVAATDSCVAIACEHEQEGETEFIMGTAVDVDPGHAPVFFGYVLTPDHRIVLETAELAVVLECRTTGTKTKVRVWTNRSQSADKVIVGID